MKHISTSALANELAINPDKILLLDAREAEEYSISHLPGAFLANTVSAVESAIDAAPNATTIVVYCSVGYRSAKLIKRLQRRGHTGLLNLEGSIFQWANENREVYRGPKTVRGVHPYDESWGELLERARWEFPGD